MSETTPMGTAPVAGSGALSRLFPLLIVAGGLGLVFAMGWHRYLSLDVIAQNRAELKALVADNFALALGGFVALYATVVALSVPGALVLTLLGGFLFGWLVGGATIVVAATLGATALFLIAKSALGNALAGRAGPFLNRLSAGFQEDALSYLLFLRLVPAFPFWLVNLAPALLGVRLRTFVLGTGLGIIPGTFAYAAVGAGLDRVFGEAQTEFDACVAAGGVACRYSVDVGALVNPTLLAAFAALGVVALIPVVLKRVRAR